MLKMLTGFVAFSTMLYINVANAYLWDGHSDGEQHEYAVVSFQGTWDQAALAATVLGEGWHLATVTSADEQSFLESNVYASITGKYWLGAWQEAGQIDPTAGWNWVTGEAWDFTNWASLEPNDYNGTVENWLLTTDAIGWEWNDTLFDGGRIVGFVAERSGASVSVPEPNSVALLSLGLIVFAAAGYIKRSNASLKA